MNYAKMIEILTKVKELRDNGDQDSEYVCDNIRFEVGGCEQFGEVELTITADIKNFIKGNFSVVEYLGKSDHSDPAVVAFRANMIDTLIARYTEALKNEAL